MAYSSSTTRMVFMQLTLSAPRASAGRYRTRSRGVSDSGQDCFSTFKGCSNINAAIGNSKFADRRVMAAFTDLHDRDQSEQLAAKLYIAQKDDVFDHRREALNRDFDCRTKQETCFC